MVTLSMYDIIEFLNCSFNQIHIFYIHNILINKCEEIFVMK